MATRTRIAMHQMTRRAVSNSLPPMQRPPPPGGGGLATLDQLTSEVVAVLPLHREARASGRAIEHRAGPRGVHGSDGIGAPAQGLGDEGRLTAEVGLGRLEL